MGLGGLRRPGTRKLATTDRGWDEMMSPREAGPHRPGEKVKVRGRNSSERSQSRQMAGARDGQTPREKETDRQTAARMERPKGRGVQRSPSSPQRRREADGPERWRDRDPGAESAHDRPEGCREGEGGKVSRREWRRAGRAQRSGRGAGSGLVKAAPSGEIAARIAELHKTPPARPAAAPAPISSPIAARAGYAFKCYLIGLRRSWGPERPPPPPRTLGTSVFQVTDCSTPPPSTFPPPDGSP